MKIEVLKAFTLPGSPRPFLPRERVTIPDADAERVISELKAVKWPYEEGAVAFVSHAQPPARRRRETATR